MQGPDSAIRMTIEAIWRMEAARVIGGLVRFVRSLDRAEDLAHDALVSALEHWPATGIPQNPGAWLMTTARHRAVDEGRRNAMMQAKHTELEYAAAVQIASVEEPCDELLEDDVLRLMLISCHPVLSKNARVALTLRLIAGLSTAEIARAFLTSEASMAQRIVRAKRTLSVAGVPFELPAGAELRTRVGPTLEVIYLIFNEGYTASSGDNWLRPELCEEAMRLGRILVGFLPDEAEAHGLLALMELQASRTRSRIGPSGDPVRLNDQDRNLWDRMRITRGLASLRRAEAIQSPLGPFTVQAAIAACHVVAASPEDTDWVRVVALYDALVELTGSPVAELNRAVAVSMAYGPAEGLALVDELACEPVLRNYHLLPAVRGDLLWKLGRGIEAKMELKKAAKMASNPRERSLLLLRAADCGNRGSAN